MTPPLTRPPYGGIKCEPLLHSARVRRRQDAIPHNGCDRSPVRQLRSLLHHSRRCSDTAGTCDALCKTCLALLSPLCCLLLVLYLL